VLAPPVSPVTWRAPPPRKPRPSTLTVAEPSARLPETSIARIPPVVPSHGDAVRPAESVADEYSGTRTTWNRRWPCVPVASAFVYVLRRPAPAPVPWRVSVPPPTGTAPVARAYS
jgi:hypothetical protein